MPKHRTFDKNSMKTWRKVYLAEITSLAGSVAGVCSDGGASGVEPVWRGCGVGDVAWRCWIDFGGGTLTTAGEVNDGGITGPSAVAGPFGVARNDRPSDNWIVWEPSFTPRSKRSASSCVRRPSDRPSVGLTVWSGLKRGFTQSMVNVTPKERAFRRIAV